MTATLTDIAPCQKQLKVEVSQETVQAEIDAVYQDLKKVASVPGFRVGQAPQDLLERYHGDKAKKEALDRLVSRSLEEALKSQSSLDLVAVPKVTDVQFDPKKPLTYLAKLEVAPEIPLGRYKKLKLARSKNAFSEETVQQILTRLQEEHAQLKPLLELRAAAAGDFLLTDLTEETKGKAPVKRRDVMIALDLEKDPQGFLKQLIGMNPKETRALQLKEGATVTVELKEIKVKDLPPLDDNLAKTVGSFESLEALREQIRKDLQAQQESSERERLRWRAREELLTTWNFDVPPSLVASQARRILKDRAMELMSQGVPASEVEGRSEFLSEQAKLDALKEVKLFFILRRIASTEQIQATPEEVNARIKALARSLQTTPEEVRKDLESRDLLDDVAWNIIRSKVLDLIIKEAQITQEEEK